MAKAHKAPEYAYQRTFVISKHALERFRERVDEEFTSRSELDLGNLLDERIKHSGNSSVVTDLDTCDKPTMVVRIENRNGAAYYAIVRDQTVVTVLDEHILQANFSSGKWKRGGFNTPFAKVKETLRGKVAEEPAEKPRKEAEPPKPPDIGALGAALAQSMLSYAAVDQTVADMHARIAELQAAMVPLVENRERAEKAVKEAQDALNTAIVNATRRTQ